MRPTTLFRRTSPLDTVSGTSCITFVHHFALTTGLPVAAAGSLSLSDAAPSVPSAPTGTLVGMVEESVATVEAIVARLLEALQQTRYPSADATWEAGVAFARRWAELGTGEYDLALKPRSQECAVTVTIEPWDEKVELAALLQRITE